MNKLVALTTLLVAASQAEVGKGRIQIFPHGKFYAKDGRNPKGWELTKEVADKIIAMAQSRQDKYLIDYEHQALLSKQNGQKVIAAGWFKDMEFIEGQGLFATNVEWTEAASEHIKKNEYRYISPTFQTDAAGNITDLFNVALTNMPAIDGMTGAVALSETPPTEPPADDNKPKSNQLLQALRTLLAESVDLNLTEAEVVNKVRALIGVTEAMSRNPDPSKFVPIGMFNEMRTEVSNLKTERLSEKVEGIVKTAIAEGKLTPSQKSWALSYGMENVTGLSQYLADAKPIVMLGQEQSVQMGTVTVYGDVEAMSERARQMGLTVEQYQERMAKMK